MKLMMTKFIFFVLLSFTNFVGAAGAAQEHCCQNELCPIDCIRCDGKPTCYDLSDELGCSNKTDKELLSYEKPPVFVPIILAVLKAQLRREKVELSYRFPDRDCFKVNQPSYDLKDDKSQETVTTTQTPVWLQLLMKLKGITTTTTTTTETPIWKLLLNKLKAEQSKGSLTTISPVSGWSEINKITTPASPASQTPPWRRTARPPTTWRMKTTEQTTTEIRDQTTVQVTEPTTTKSRDQTTVQVTEPIVTKSRDQTTAQVTEPIVTKLRDQNNVQVTEQTTTKLRDQTTTKITEPTFTEMKDSSTEQTTEKETFSNSAQSFPTGIPITMKETVFFTTPKQEFVTKIEQEVATEIQPQISTKNVLDMSSAKVHPNTTTEFSLSTKPVLYKDTTTSVPDTDMGNDADNISTAVTNSQYSNTTEHLHVNTTTGVIEVSEATAKTVVSFELNENSTNTNVTEISTFLPTESVKETQNMSMEAHVNANLTVLLDLNHTQEHTNMLRNASEADIKTTTILGTTAASNVSQMQNTDETSGKEYIQRNVSDTHPLTTELPLFFATADFGITVSPEFVKTVTESETPAPLQERVITSVSANESLEKNLTEITFGLNDTRVSGNNSFDNLDNNVANITDFPKLQNEIIKERGNGQVYVNTSEFINGAREKYSSSLNLNLSAPSHTNVTPNISHVSELVDNLLANYTNASVSLLSGNLTSSDFIYPSLETKFAEHTGANFSYSVSESNIHSLGLYNSSYTNKDKAERDNNFSVSIVEKQEKASAILKDKVGTSSVQMSPDNEVRIMLGKLNALVGKPLASSDFPSQPVLREFSQTKQETAIVHHDVMSTPSSLTKSFEEAPISQFPERTHVIQPVTVPLVQSATVSPLPWWQQPTISPFSLDNLFGFTTTPPIGQDWFNPTTNAYSWDAIFGVGGIPVSQPATVPSYTATQDIPYTNAIYDPVSHIQSTAPINPPVQTTGNFGQGINKSPPMRSIGITSKPDIPQKEYSMQATDFQNSFLHTDKPTTKAYIPSWNSPATRSHILQKVPPVTPRPLRVFDIFNNGMDSKYPGNFSITAKPSIQTTVPPFYQPSTQLSPNINNFVVQTTASIPLESAPSESIALSPVTFPPVSLQKSKNTYTTEPDTIRSYSPSDKVYTSALSSANKQDVKIVYDVTTPRPASPRKLDLSSKSPLQPIASVVTNFWYTNTSSQNTYVKPVTDPIPVTSVTDPIPVTPVTAPIPVTPITAAIPVTPVTDPIPVTPVTDPIPVTPVTDSIPVIPVTNAIPVTPVIGPISVIPVTDPIPITPVKAAIPVTPVTDFIPDIPVTDPFPVTEANTKQTQATTLSFWNSNSNRILSTDIISSWWAQVQPTTPAPSYVTSPAPTPTAVASLDHCYETQDPTGFCQQRYSGHYRNPSDCRSFYVCIWGLLHSCSCPQNTMFDDTIKVCNWDHLVTCTQQV